jgi:alpha-L-fucosidase
MDKDFEIEFERDITEGPFKPEWESLKNYKCPEWFRDAKFGIWAHWGPQAVPGAGDWYARQMYVEGHEQYKYHIEHYGHPSKFGYKDILPLWKAENFDPDALMQLYKKAGAKYFTGLAVHHDNFDCWNSAYHKWNSVNMGPKKDIIGLWKKAAAKHGLYFGVTEHLERTYSWFNTNKGKDSEGPYAGVPYDGNDPEFEDLYLEPHEDSNYAYPANPSKAWQRAWFMRMKDLVEKYQPDLLYTDGGVPFGKVGLSMISNFYNNSIKAHNGLLEAVYAVKDMRRNDMIEKTYHGEYQEGIGVLDVERGVIGGMRMEPWQTDTCIGEWFYKKGFQYKTDTAIIHMLVDIVSKNGNLLLNFPLQGDGTLDEESLNVVHGISEWMAVNGEAIYGTRPWKVFGEGPVQAPGGFFNENVVSYTPMDFRFTTKGDILYAIFMTWPDNGFLTVKSLAADGHNAKVCKVSLLGFQGELSWEQHSEGLRLYLPEGKPCKSAWTLKVEK